MNTTLLHPLLAMLPASLLLAGSLCFFLQRRNTWSFLQLLRLQDELFAES